MKKKLTFLAILIAILPTLVVSEPLSNRETAMMVLDLQNASYMLRMKQNGMYVVTFHHEEPIKTCKSLQNMGISVINVTNHAENGKISRDC